MKWKSLASCVVAGTVLMALPALAADYLGAAPPPAPAYAQPTVCASHAVLATIDRKFGYRARSYLHSNLDVVDFYGARETYYRPADETHLVGRTYCEATVVLNDHRPRPVWYLIETTWGFAGIGDSLEYCISGLDPWHVYGANCTSLRH